MNWYLKVLKKYAVFTGRAQRKEYWLFLLFNVLISFVLGFIDGFAGLIGKYGWGPLGGLYSVAVIIPATAVQVRRLHDINRSGWWLFTLTLILASCALFIKYFPLNSTADKAVALLLIGLSFIGCVVVFVFTVRDSTPGHNQYGPNPKEENTSMQTVYNTLSSPTPHPLQLIVPPPLPTKTTTLPPIMKSRVTPPPLPPVDEWWIGVDGKQQGPFNTAKIRELLSSGKATIIDSYIWKNGMEEWKPIAEIEKFNQL